MKGVTVGIPTKGRYDILDNTLLSIALQTLKPLEVIIVDDSDERKDIREIQHYEYILRLFDDKGIKWRVVWGAGKGQHHSHQLIQEEAKGDYIFRIDDDEVAEPDVLFKLVNAIRSDEKVGAVAPSVTMPNPSILPKGLGNFIEDLEKPNMQWYKDLEAGTYYAEHLYSCFLYRKGIAKYDLSLSTVAHREETIFSHSIFREGWKLKVVMGAQVYHFRAGGGIRTFNDPSLWEHDEKIFQGYLDLWGVKKDRKKVIVLDNGLGDHWAFKNILLDIEDKDITIACCYPEVFYDSDVKLISIAEAKLMYGNIDNFNIYKFMGDRDWKGSIVDAFKELYINGHNNIPILKTNEKREAKPKELPDKLLAKGYRLFS